MFYRKTFKCAYVQVACFIGRVLRVLASWHTQHWGSPLKFKFCCIQVHFSYYRLICCKTLHWRSKLAWWSFYCAWVWHSRSSCIYTYSKEHAWTTVLRCRRHSFKLVYLVTKEHLHRSFKSVFNVISSSKEVFRACGGTNWLFSLLCWLAGGYWGVRCVEKTLFHHKQWLYWRKNRKMVIYCMGNANATWCTSHKCSSDRASIRWKFLATLLDILLSRRLESALVPFHGQALVELNNYKYYL